MARFAARSCHPEESSVFALSGSTPLSIYGTEIGTLMARIRARGNRFQARVTHKGCETLAKTFRTQSAAESWPVELEERFESGDLLLPAPRKRLTFSEALGRYEREVTPQQAWSSAGA